MHRGSAPNVEVEVAESSEGLKSRSMSLPMNPTARDQALGSLATDINRAAKDSDDDDESEEEEPMQVFRPFGGAPFSQTPTATLTEKLSDCVLKDDTEET